MKVAHRRELRKLPRNQRERVLRSIIFSRIRHCHLEVVRTLGDAKTGAGIAYWRRELCCGQLRLPGCNADTGLPDLDLQTAWQRGARSLVIGIAPMGGVFAGPVGGYCRLVPMWGNQSRLASPRAA